ncbi:MAG: type II secretion system F family protein [Gemmatimonadetes bacterium]|nr:type II secretion system F family protein [Gemmatimonadota bacterium]
MSLPAGNWPGAILGFVAISLAVVTLALIWEAIQEWKRRRAVAEQIKQLSAADLGGGGSQEISDALLREGEGDEPRWLQPIVARFPQRRDIQHLLEQADLSWSVGTFLLVTGGLGVAFGLAGMFLVPGGLIPLLLGAGGASLPYFYLRRRRTKRIAEFEKHFPEAIDLLGRSIRAGHALNSGLEVIAEELPAPVSEEFRQVFEEQKFGLPLRDSLMAMADRIPLVDLRIFVIAVLIQRESGGNLAEILDNISYTIRERFKIQRQLKVYTAQGRLTGYLLAVLPIVMGVILYTVSPEYMSVLFEESTGRLVLGFAGVLQIVGYLVIRRIIDIDI